MPAIRTLTVVATACRPLVLPAATKLAKGTPCCGAARRRSAALAKDHVEQPAAGTSCEGHGRRRGRPIACTLPRQSASGVVLAVTSVRAGTMEDAGAFGSGVSCTRTLAVVATNYSAGLSIRRLRHEP